VNSTAIKLSLDRDIGILMFLWQWKAATTAMLGMRFYGSDKSTGIYQRLSRLEKGGYIQTRCGNRGQHFAWTLSGRGFQVIEGRLPKLVENGFKSENLGHDLLVSAIHLGDWVAGIPHGCGVFTEQQLRRLPESEYPDWVPQTTRHRPDGYWKVLGGDKPRVIALEVELCRKADRDYKAVAEFYQAWKRIYRVIWVVENPKDAAALATKFKSMAEGDGDYHNFITIDQIVNSGWQAIVLHGKDQGSSLADLLYDSTMTRPKQVIGMSLMNASKAPYRTAGYAVFAPSDFRN
jgi:hypothetical protein